MRKTVTKKQASQGTATAVLMNASPHSASDQATGDSLVAYALDHMSCKWDDEAFVDGSPKERQVKIKITESKNGDDIGLQHPMAMYFSKADAIEVVESVCLRKFGSEKFAIDSISLLVDGDKEDHRISIEAQVFV